MYVLPIEVINEQKHYNIIRAQVYILYIDNDSGINLFNLITRAMQGNSMS